MSADVNAGPFHEKFSWLPDNIKHDINAGFAAKVRTAASGCLTIARITEQYLIDTSTNERTLLSHGDMQSLVGLIAPLMVMLDDAADCQIYRLSDDATKGAGK
jgi:hypothetical protein